jgi:hypothetical protein
MADSSVSETTQLLRAWAEGDVSSKRSAEIVALDDALSELARLAPRKARIVELRFFAGL